MIFLLKDFAYETLPISLRDYIKREIFDCEIGFGDGRTIVDEAKVYPEKGFVGVEYSYVSTKKAEKRVGKEGITNVLFIKSEASVAFDILFRERQFSRIIIRFPDPWPKKRHIKNRLLTKEFLPLAANRLMDGGEMYITTDDTGYKDFIIGQISLTNYFIPIFPGGYRLKGCSHISTRYEEKWRNMGKDIYEIGIKKAHHPEIKKHIILSTYFHLPPIKDVYRLSGKTIKDGNTILRTGKLHTMGRDKEIWIYLVDWHLFQKTKLILQGDGNKFIPLYNKEFLPTKSFEMLKNLMESCQ